MDLTSLLPYASFGVISFTAWAIISFFNGKQSRATERLDEMRDPGRRARDESAGSNMGRMLEKAAPALSQALQPKSELEVSELKIRLNQNRRQGFQIVDTGPHSQLVEDFTAWTSNLQLKVALIEF